MPKSWDGKAWVLCGATINSEPGPLLLRKEDGGLTADCHRLVWSWFPIIHAEYGNHGDQGGNTGDLGEQFKGPPLVHEAEQG